MILDGHVHIWNTEPNYDDFTRRLGEAGIDGAAVISLSPSSLRADGSPTSPRERFDNLMAWSRGGENLYPLYWIDPVADGAAEQVAMAVEGGVSGFKVICGQHEPGDARAMKIYRLIAKAGKSILFHSEILWDGKPSAQYNRPAAFEALLEVDNLKFCLAHISWPWCDELIAVYGKFLNAYTRRSDLSVEMFIDITPGTPPIYRRDALTKLFTAGYDVENNVIFGTDCGTGDYNSPWAKQWLERDGEIFRDLNLSQETVEKINCDNLKRFLGLTKDTIEKRTLSPGQ